MQKTTCSLVLAAMIGGLTACDDTGRRQSALDEAIQKVQTAEQGYAVGSGDQPADLDRHRREAFAEAARQLRDVSVGGSAAQQTIARRLLAEISASTARLAAKDAAEAYADLAPRAIDLLRLAMAADNAAARGRFADQSQPRVIAALREEVAAQQQRQAQFQTESGQLKSQIAGEQTALQAIEARRDEAAGRAQQLRDRAFVAEGDEQYRLAEEAAAADRQSTIASAEGDRHRLNLDMLQSRLSVIDSQLRLTGDLLTELQRRIDATQQRQSDVARDIAQANELRDQQLAALQERLNETLSQYRDQVDEKLEQATSRIDEAVTVLQSAQAQDQQARQNIQIDLLAARTAQAHLYAEHLLVSAGFHGTLSTLHKSVSAIQGARMTGLQEAVEQFGQRQGELAGKAREAIQAGQELASQLGNQEQAERLSAYARRLDAIRVQ